MSIVKKTKQDRDLATPGASTPDLETPAFDLKTALDDIGRRSLDRKKSIERSQAKLEESRLARSRETRSIAGEGGRLYGLASFAGTTGK